MIQAERCSNSRELDREYITLHSLVNGNFDHEDGIYRFRSDICSDKALIYFSNDVPDDDWMKAYPVILIFDVDGGVEPLDPECWSSDTEVYFEDSARLLMSILSRERESLNI